MARIPNPDSIARQPIDGVAPVTGLNVRDVGAGFDMVAGALDEQREKIDRSQLAKAESDFLVLKAKQDNAYDQDEDYRTIQERYQGQMEEGLGKIATTIENAQLRNEFVSRYRVSVVEGTERMADVAWNKERDYERADLTRRMDELRETGLQSNESLVASSQQVELLMQSAVEMDYIDAEDKENMSRKWKDSLALGRLKMMDPEQRVDALKHDWAKNLPSDTRAVLMREAREASNSSKAQRIVDGMSEMDLAEGFAHIQRKYAGDPKLRSAVEDRFTYQVGMREKAEAMAGRDLLDQYYDDVRGGEKTVAQVRDEMGVVNWESLGAERQSTLFSAEKSAAGTTETRFNGDAEDMLNSLLKSGERVKLFKKYDEIRDTLSASQRNKWSELALEGVTTPEIDDGLNDQQAIDAYYPDRTTHKTQRARMITGLSEWRINFIQNNNRSPNAKERREALDMMIEEHTRDSFLGMWSTGQSFADMDEGDLQSQINAYKEQDPDLWESMEQAYSQAGVFVSDFRKLSKFKELYEERRRAAK